MASPPNWAKKGGHSAPWMLYIWTSPNMLPKTATSYTHLQFSFVDLQQVFVIIRPLVGPIGAPTPRARSTSRSHLTVMDSCLSCRGLGPPLAGPAQVGLGHLTYSMASLTRDLFPSPKADPQHIHCFTASRLSGPIKGHFKRHGPFSAH